MCRKISGRMLTALQLQSEHDLVRDGTRLHTETSRWRPEVGAAAELLLMLLSPVYDAVFTP